MYPWAPGIASAKYMYFSICLCPSLFVCVHMYVHACVHVCVCVCVSILINPDLYKLQLQKLTDTAVGHSVLLNVAHVFHDDISFSSIALP